MLTFTKKDLLDSCKEDTITKLKELTDEEFQIVKASIYEQLWEELMKCSDDYVNSALALFQKR